MSKPVVRRPREGVAPFLRGRTWWARVPRLEANSVQRSLGVTGKENEDVALNVCAFLVWCRKRRETFLLDAMALGKVRVGLAYTAYTEGRLDGFVVELRDGVKDTDIEPFVAKWVKELERRKKPSAGTRAKYLKQVRAFIPEGQPFRRSQFTKQAIRDFLGSLSVEQPNRYRAALSSFAKFLLFEDVLAINPVVQVPMAKEAEPRTLHLSQDEVGRLLKALEEYPERGNYVAPHALMLATGMEISAALAVRPQDVGENQVYAAGTKREHRRRTVGIYDRWLWVWQAALVGMFMEGKAVFPGMSVGAAYRSLRWALNHKPKRGRSLVEDRPELAKYTTHDHRHTWAVQAIRDRVPLPMIANNLGHRDSAMIHKVYGRFAPTGADFSRITSLGATAMIAPEATE